MCINKDMKNAVVRPTTPYLQKTSLFLRYRITAYKSLLQQLFPHSDTDSSDNLIYNKSLSCKEREENIASIIELIKAKELLPPINTCNRGLINTISGLAATPEQQYDLLHFREIGEEHLAQYINLRILRQPSTNAPVRKHRLMTMDARKQTHKRALSMKDKEHKQLEKCLRQRLAWCNQTGNSYDPSTEQYSTLPRALSDAYGCPHKESSQCGLINLGDTTPVHRLC